MGRKRKLTAAEKQAKKERNKKYKSVFINGKQLRIKREPEIDGIPVDEWIEQNADPLWLHQNEMWEYIDPTHFDLSNSQAPYDSEHDETDIPF